MKKRNKFLGAIWASILWFKRPNKFVGIAIWAFTCTMIAFRSYYREFDGAHSGMDLLWGGLVSIVLFVPFFMYFRIAKKIENFSPAWFFMLTISVHLLVFGFLLGTGIIFDFGIRYVAWGAYMYPFGVFIPMTHFLFRRITNPPQKDSFFKRISFSQQEKDMA